MRCLIKIGVMALVGICFAGLLHKENITVEYGKRFDSNILLPDSVTHASAIVTEASAAPSFLIQFNPATMARLRLELGTEEQDAFPGTNIKRLGATLNAKHLFSHLTMAGFGFALQNNYSDNAYYEVGEQSAYLNMGRYFGPRNNLETKLSGRQKNFPLLYRNSIKDLTKRSYYYDYREMMLENQYQRTLSNEWSVLTVLSGAYKDYYNDVHDSDYVGYRTVINYVDINTTPWDTAYDTLAAYQPNIHQKDQNLFLDISATWTPLQAISFVPRLSGGVTLSNDDYFDSRSWSAEMLVRVKLSRSSFRFTYNIEKELFPQRNMLTGKQEQSQYAAISYSFELYQNIQLHCGFNYRKFDSTADIDDYEKKTVSAILSVTR